MSDHAPDPRPAAPSNNESPPGMPRWVEVAVIVVGLLVLLFVTARLTGLAGEHGPGRHMSGQAPAPTSTWLAQPVPTLF